MNHGPILRPQSCDAFVHLRDNQIVSGWNDVQWIEQLCGAEPPDPMHPEAAF